MTYQDGYYVVEKKKSRNSSVAQLVEGLWHIMGESIPEDDIEKKYKVCFFVSKSSESSEIEEY
jgi:hypothetical protein